MVTIRATIGMQLGEDFVEIFAAILALLERVPEGLWYW